MPYYRCTSCSLISYSAANYSTVGICAHCDSPLAGSEVVREPERSPRLFSRRSPVASGAMPRGAAR